MREACTDVKTSCCLLQTFYINLHPQIDWDSFVLRVAHKDVLGIEDFLSRITEEEILRRRENMRRVARGLSWHWRDAPGALAMLMQELYQGVGARSDKVVITGAVQTV
jgi:hypothetical protein